jgi:hypothetical protein
MMQFINDNKYYIGLIVIILVGLWAYMTYYQGPSSDASLSSDDTGSPLSQDVLVTLSHVKAITLDPSIFSDPVYQSLNDFGVTIPLQPIGRRNPFAPVE